MINERQEQLDRLYAETFGGSGDTETIDEPVSDLVLAPDAYPPRDKFRSLLEKAEFREICENRGNFPSLSEHDISLASFAANDDWSDQEIADLIIAFRRKYGQTREAREKALRLDYIQRTLAKVRSRVKSKKRPTVASQLVELARDIELFHTPGDVPYAIIKRDGHTETWELSGQSMKDYLSRRYYEETGGITSARVMQDALGVLRAKAKWEGLEKPVYIRVAGFDNKIYLDLCTSEWSVVEITATGWQIIQSPPVHFVRKPGMISLPVPEERGNINVLRDFVNVADDDWPLLLAWLVSAFMPEGPYPVLVVNGEHGTAKSYTTYILRMLVDPSTSPLRFLPKGERNLVITASNSWIVAFDNVSGLPGWLSDAICRLSTGGGLGIRKLYTDAEEVLFTSKRPVILNGIGDIASRSDLLNRTIILTLPTIPDDQRREEADLGQDFEIAHPQILASLLDSVSSALRNLADVKLASMPRMADFAKWAVAAIPDLGVDSNDFLEAYERNIQDIDHLALESTSVVKEIMILVSESSSGLVWEGTASALLEELSYRAGDIEQRQRDWPKSPRALGAILSRLAPNLRAVGIIIKRYRRGGKYGERIISIKKGVQGYTTPPKRRERCKVTKLESGGYRIQMRV